MQRRWMAAAALALALGLLGIWWVTRPPETPPEPPVPAKAAPAPRASPELIPLSRRASTTPPREAASEPAAAPEPEPEPLAPAAVAGIVQDEEGRPVPRAGVYLLVFAIEKGQRHEFLESSYLKRSRWLTTAADDLGRFDFPAVHHFGDGRLGAASGEMGGVKAVKLESGKKLEGEVITIASENLFRGRVVAQDGGPVADAVVSIYHSWSEKDYAGSSGLAAAGEDGRFAIGVNPKADRLSLRVNSETHGQDFFLDQPLTAEETLLVMKRPAGVRGRITWVGGAPAAGLIVAVSAEVPEPAVLQSRTGMRLRTAKEAVAGAGGEYEIAGLQPGFEYYIYVTSGGPDRNQARLKPLTPMWGNSFKLAPGEVKVWDRSIENPIFVAGSVRTERLGTPRPYSYVGVRKDGKPIHDIHCQTDEEGNYRLQISHGPGTYTVFAQPESHADEHVADLVIERFGKTLTFRGGEEVACDLLIYEPITLPVRVLDAAGKPVKSIQAHIGFQISGGRRYGMSSSYSLDDGGRRAFTLHFPVAEFTLEVGPFPEGPKAEAQTFQAEIGQVLPEWTIHLPRTCDLSGVLVDAAGAALEGIYGVIEAKYADGARESFSFRTDQQGAFSKSGCIRTQPVTIAISSRDPAGKWESETLDASSGLALDLGRVALAPK